MLKRAPRLPPRMASKQYTDHPAPVVTVPISNDSSLAYSAQHFCNKASAFRQSLLDDMNKREGELKEKSKRLERDMNELQRRLETVSRAEKRLAKVQRQLTETEAALQAKNNELSQLTANHATMKQRVVDLERRLESRAINIVTAESNITLERQRLAELKKKANDMIDEAMTAKEEATKLCKRYLNDKAQLDEKSANYQFLQLENKELKRKLEEMDQLNRVRDDEFSRLRTQQESEIALLKQEKLSIKRMDELYTTREAAMALRERELERMLKEIEGIRNMSSSKAAQMDLEHQKFKLECNATIESLTYRIKTKDIELSKIQAENAHLKSITANSLSSERANELKAANNALSEHVEELTAHLLSLNSAIDRLQTENIALIEENKHNISMLDHLQRLAKIPTPVPDVADSEETLPHRSLSPAAKHAADRLLQYNSILSRSQPVDGLRSAINRQKGGVNERLLDIQDLQQTRLDTGKFSTNSHAATNDVVLHSRSAEAAAFNIIEEAHLARLKCERNMMLSEDILSSLYRDMIKVMEVISAKSQELQTKEEFIQQICGQIKIDAESIIAERNSLDQQKCDLEKVIAEAVESQLQNKIAIYEKERGVELMSPEFKKTFVEILRLHKQMPESDAIYILERIISRATSVKRSNSILRMENSSSTDTIKSYSKVIPLTEVSSLPRGSFKCEYCGKINAITSHLVSLDTNNKLIQTDSLVSELKEICTLADQLQSSTNKTPLGSSSIQSMVSSHLPSTSIETTQVRPNISINAAVTNNLNRIETPKAPALQNSLSNYLEGQTNYSRFSMLDTLKQNNSVTMLSRTAADLSKTNSESLRSASSKSSRSSRSHSLGRATLNTDTRSVRFSGVLEHVSSPHREVGNKANTQSILLTGDSVQALDTYLQRRHSVVDDIRPVNLISSSETMTSLADPSPSTDRTPITANTSSMSNTSIGSHERPYYREAKQNAAELNRLLMKTESLTKRQLPVKYSEGTHTSISSITRPGSSRIPQQIPTCSTSDMTLGNLPDSQLLRQIEDILTRSGAESPTLDPPSLSQSGGYQERYLTMHGAERTQHIPPYISKFSAIYGLESPEGRHVMSTSDNMGTSDSCIYV